MNAKCESILLYAHELNIHQCDPSVFYSNVKHVQLQQFIRHKIHIISDNIYIPEVTRIDFAIIITLQGNTFPVFLCHCQCHCVDEDLNLTNISLTINKNNKNRS